MYCFSPQRQLGCFARLQLSFSGLKRNQAQDCQRRSESLVANLSENESANPNFLAIRVEEDLALPSLNGIKGPSVKDYGQFMKKSVKIHFPK